MRGEFNVVLFKGSWVILCPVPGSPLSFSCSCLFPVMTGAGSHSGSASVCLIAIATILGWVQKGHPWCLLVSESGCAHSRARSVQVDGNDSQAKWADRVRLCHSSAQAVAFPVTQAKSVQFWGSSGPVSQSEPAGG